MTKLQEVEATQGSIIQALAATVIQLQEVETTQSASIKSLQNYLNSDIFTVTNLVVTGSLKVRQGINVNGGDTLGVGITLNGVGILAHGGTIIGDTI